MYDSMLVIKEAFTDILSDNPYALKPNGAEPACDSGSDFLDDIRPFEYGQIVNQHLRRVGDSFAASGLILENHIINCTRSLLFQVQTEGLTGNIQFHENGTRKYFTVDVVELVDDSVQNKVRLSPSLRPIYP
jgi:hypothetical protein